MPWLLRTSPLCVLEIIEVCSYIGLVLVLYVELELSGLRFKVYGSRRGSSSIAVAAVVVVVVVFILGSYLFDIQYSVN